MGSGMFGGIMFGEYASALLGGLVQLELDGAYEPVVSVDGSNESQISLDGAAEPSVSVDGALE